eukprot:5291405-Prymnesium_polylepis.2
MDIVISEHITNRVGEHRLDARARGDISPAFKCISRSTESTGWHAVIGQIPPNVEHAEHIVWHARRQHTSLRRYACEPNRAWIVDYKRIHHWGRLQGGAQTLQVVALGGVHTKVKPERLNRGIGDCWQRALEMSVVEHDRWDGDSTSRLDRCVEVRVL